MGILDDAIREHLDLKRAHGARDSELREIEDEALGSGERPDPFASGELFNEVSSGATGTETEDAPSAPEARAPQMPSDAGGPALDEEPTRLVEPGGADLGSTDEPISPPEGLRELPGEETPAPPSIPETGDEPIPGQERFDEQIPGQESLGEIDRLDRPSREPEPPAMPEPPATPEPPSDEIEPPAPSESLEELMAEEEPFPEDAEAPPPTPEPPASSAPLEPPRAKPDLEDEEGYEPESSVPDPPPPPPGSEPAGRARGRVDVPTQEHPPPGETGGIPPVQEDDPYGASDDFEDDEPPAATEPEPPEGGPALYDFETDEDPGASEEAPRPAAPPGETDDDFEALGPAEEEGSYTEDEEPGTAVRPVVEEEAYEGEKLDPEETYEEEDGEDLWFEKGPPQDFDFEEDR